MLPDRSVIKQTPLREQGWLYMTRNICDSLSIMLLKKNFFYKLLFIYWKDVGLKPGPQIKKKHQREQTCWPMNSISVYTTMLPSFFCIKEEFLKDALFFNEK